ncbi:MAG: hypothetical protein PHI19_04395 [Clostridia bacterium]|nr:hypothetical protein [Clostridia bacterium]
MKKTLLVACIIVLCAVVLLGCMPKAETRYDINILKGGSPEGVFDYDGSVSALQENWTLTSGGTGTEPFSNASNYLSINTSKAGYATASQTVHLKPNSYYKIRYSFTSTAMTAVDTQKGYVGLYVGFLEDETFNKYPQDKFTEHRGATSGTETGEFYFRNGNVREASLAIFVGSQDKPVNVSSVVIKDIALTRVDKATAIENGSTVGLYTLDRTTYGKATSFNNLYIIIGGIATLLLAYAFYMLRARVAATANGEPKNAFAKQIVSNKYLGLLLVIGTGLLVRLAIVLTESFIAGQSVMQTVYHGFHLGNNASHGIWLAQYGMPYFFQYNPEAAFMPFALYFDTLAGLVGRIAQAAGATEAIVTLTTAATLKMFAVAADIGVAVIIYKLIASKQGKLAATVVAGLYTLLPVTLSLSAAWGSMESIAVFFAVLSFYFLLRKNYWGAVSAYFVSALITPAMLLVSPFLLCYTGLLIYRGIKDKKVWGWLTPALTIVASLILFFLITLPYAVNDIGKGDVFFAFDKYVEAVKGANVYTANAFNFQGLIGNNFKPVSTESTFVTILFVLFILALFCVAYFRSKNRLQLVMLAAGFIVVYWVFTNNMAPASIFLALPLMYLYTALVKDKRLYVAFALYAAMMFVNIGYINMVAGYDEAGIVQLGYENGMMYAFGSLNLVLIIYFVIVGYDSIVNNKTSEFLVLRVPYGTYVSSVSANALITVRNLWAKVKAFSKQVVNAIKEDIAESKAKRKLKTEAKKLQDKEDQ